MSRFGGRLLDASSKPARNTCSWFFKTSPVRISSRGRAARSGKRPYPSDDPRPYTGCPRKSRAGDVKKGWFVAGGTELITGTDTGSDSDSDSDSDSSLDY